MPSYIAPNHVVSFLELDSTSPFAVTVMGSTPDGLPSTANAGVLEAEFLRTTGIGDETTGDELYSKIEEIETFFNSYPYAHVGFCPPQPGLDYDFSGDDAEAEPDGEGWTADDEAELQWKDKHGFLLSGRQDPREIPAPWKNAIWASRSTDKALFLQYKQADAATDDGLELVYGFIDYRAAPDGPLVTERHLASRLQSRAPTLRKLLGMASRVAECTRSGSVTIVPKHIDDKIRVLQAEGSNDEAARTRETYMLRLLHSCDRDLNSSLIKL